MSNTITGRLHLVKPTQVVSDKFSKREFVIETTEQYPQFISLEFTQDKCAVLDGYQEGQQVTVDFNLRGREWNGKYYNTLQAWKISREAGSEGIASGAIANAVSTPTHHSTTLADVPSTNPAFSEDLPF